MSIRRTTLFAVVTPVVLVGLLAGSARQSPPAGSADAQATEAPPDPLPRLRTIARMMVNIEARHRTQATELEALARYCDRERHYDMLRTVIQVAHAERADYTARMEGFERDLGAELYGRMRAAMDVPPGTEPPLRALIPEPPPPPEPFPHEIEAEAAEKRAREHAEEQGDQDDGR